jgi:hypothetical protein
MNVQANFKGVSVFKEKYDHFIGGEWVSARLERRSPSITPQRLDRAERARKKFVVALWRTARQRLLPIDMASCDSCKIVM